MRSVSGNAHIGLVFSLCIRSQLNDKTIAVTWLTADVSTYRLSAEKASSHIATDGVNVSVLNVAFTFVSPHHTKQTKQVLLDLNGYTKVSLHPTLFLPFCKRDMGLCYSGSAAMCCIASLRQSRCSSSAVIG